MKEKSNKKMKKTFVTLFLECPNIGLIKDVGQIPYHLGNRSNLYTTLVSSELNFGGPFLNEVDGLELVNVPLLFGNVTLTGILYIIKNAKNIDWLNLYHYRRRTLIWAYIYKLFNKSGNLYIKLDSGFVTIKKLQEDKYHRRKFIKLLELADVVSAESKYGANEFTQIANKPVVFIPNGVRQVDDSVIKEKENAFLTVGRLGAKEKNTDLLLEAYAQIAEDVNWKLNLVGPVEKNFEECLKNFFFKFPQLKERIHLFGEITDKDELYRIYSKSKIFVLPSSFESFSIACAEAVVNGCYLVLSDQVTPKEDFTDAWKYGCESKLNPLEFSKNMKRAIDVVESNKFNLYEEIEYGRDNFSWERICDRLFEYLSSVG